MLEIASLALCLTPSLCCFSHSIPSITKLTSQRFPVHFLVFKILCPNCTRRDDRTQDSRSADVLSPRAFPFHPRRTTHIVDCGQQLSFLLRLGTKSLWELYTMDISVGQFFHKSDSRFRTSNVLIPAAHRLGLDCHIAHSNHRLALLYRTSSTFEHDFK
jgi:hypothetical protein